MAARRPAVRRAQTNSGAAIPGDQAGGEGDYSPGQGGRTRRICPGLAGQRQRRRQDGKSGRREGCAGRTVQNCMESTFCCCSVAQLFPTLYHATDCSTPGYLSFIISWSCIKFTSTGSVSLSNRLILCHPLLLLPPIFLSSSVFPHESALRIRWPK